MPAAIARRRSNQESKGRSHCAPVCIRSRQYTMFLAGIGTECPVRMLRARLLLLFLCAIKVFFIAYMAGVLWQPAGSA